MTRGVTGQCFRLRLGHVLSKSVIKFHRNLCWVRLNQFELTRPENIGLNGKLGIADTSHAIKVAENGFENPPAV